MRRELRLRPEAEFDLTDAALWYQEQASGLGGRFLDQASAVFFKIIEAPEKYEIVYRDIRRAFMRRFPFGVYFLIENKIIIVVAIMHARRDPMRWKERS